MHKVDERVELSDLTALTAIYHTFLNLFFDQRLSREPKAVMAGLDPAIHAADAAPRRVGPPADHRVEPGDDAGD
jgi:hypothetical protein